MNKHHTVSKNGITLSSKYQIVIPKDVREQMNLKPGQKFRVMAVQGQIRLVPVMTTQELRGFAPGIDTNVERESDRL